MKSTTTRAPRRNAEQIARDELAMTEKKLSLVIARLDRLAEEESKARAEKVHLQTLRDYQAAHPLLQQLEIIGDPQ